MFKCIFASHIILRSYRETVSFMNVSPIDAFDVFEAYEMFLYSIRAFLCTGIRYLLLQAWILAGESEFSGTIWRVFAWPLLYSMYNNN